MRIFVSEFVGIFLLTFLGAGAILQAEALGPEGFGLLGIALVNGIVLSVAVTATMHISGAHINPAVTIAFLLTGKCRAKDVPAYFVAQVSGAFVAAVLLKPIFPASIVAATNLGTPTPAADLPFATVFLVEFLLTFALAIVIWGTAVDSRAPRIGGFGIGLIVFVAIMVGGPLSGAAMNPARVLGPAMASGVWEMHHVYWIGPILGALAGSWLYKSVLLDE